MKLPKISLTTIVIVIGITKIIWALANFISFYFLIVYNKFSFDIYASPNEVKLWFMIILGTEFIISFFVIILATLAIKGVFIVSIFNALTVIFKSYLKIENSKNRIFFFLCWSLRC
jgi:hypothetical protein